MRSSSAQALFGSGRPVVIPFLTAGFPSRRTFLEAAQIAHAAGAAALEIGMPFSDPLADGPAIQHSSQGALAAGMTLEGVFDLAATVRARLPIPLFLMGYLNPVLRLGMERFARMAKAAGVAGTIIPDCPVEEAAAWVRCSRRQDLENIFLIAPTSSEERIRRIDRRSTSFSYCVSVAGVTGARRAVTRSTRDYLARVRRVAQKPYVVGFGIARPEHIRALRGLADGFVVGSALVPLLEERNSGLVKAGRLIRGLVRAAE
ncbi:MAG TPA: tryptophan synthase subunit alpha [bacterium]|nr:tryptophan synthase subunit alpha [bacterium]